MATEIHIKRGDPLPPTVTHNGKVYRVSWVEVSTFSDYAKDEAVFIAGEMELEPEAAHFRFQPTAATDYVLNASLTVHRGGEWKVAGIFSLRPDEYELLAKVFSDSAMVEVVTNDAAEPIPAHSSQSSEAPRR
jgi:hypothetical protein